MLGALEQTPEIGDVTQERSFCGLRGNFRLEDTTQDNRLAVSNQYLCCHFISIDRRDTCGYFAPGILVDHEIHNDFVIGRNLRGHLKRKHRFLERYRSRTTGRRFLIRDLFTRFDRRALAICSHHSGLGHNFRTTITFKR